MMSSELWLAIAAALVILALAAHATFLWVKVWKQQKADTAVKSSQEAQRNQRLARDIRFLADGLVTGQVPMIEGAIRIKVLLDNYSGARCMDMDLTVFEAIYDSTVHIPTHQSWQALPRSERRLHERHMETLERNHARDLLKAAEQLRKGLN
jgi:ABC-type nickel/cobalt efflux system permease component RcnA